MRAILSVYDKTGVVDFARGLEALGFELFSTGGTEGLLREAGINVRGVQEITGFPEMLGGRVKTLHPAVHGGILALRDDPGHLEELARHDLKPIDLVASNLYPFLSVARDSGARLPLQPAQGLAAGRCGGRQSASGEQIAPATVVVQFAEVDPIPNDDKLSSQRP